MVQVINMALSNPELPVVAGDHATELVLQVLMATSDSDSPHSPASSFSRETNEANLFSFIYFFHRFLTDNKQSDKNYQNNEKIC